MSSQTFSTFSEVGMIDARLRSGTITLPLTTAIPYRILTMKDIYGATGLSTTTIQTTAPDVFEDGTSTRILNTPYQSLTVYAGQPGKWMLTATSLSNATTIGTLNISTLNVSSVTNFMNAGQITSTVQGLGTAGYVSSQQLLSTSAGLVNPGQLTSTVQGLGSAGYASTSYIGAGLSTMSTNLARNQFINQLAASTFNVSSVIGNNAYFSTLTVDNLNIGQAAGYIALGDIIVNSASTINQYAGTTYNTISYTSTANVSSLNVYQVNAQNMIGLLSTVNLTSTVQGLGSAGYVSSTQLLSTSLGLQNYINTFIDPPELASTVQGLGSAGYVSSTQLLSTSLGLVSYINSFIDPTELTSTVIGLGTGGFVSTLGLTYSLASTVTGLGTLGYISTSQLLSTTVGVYQAITAATNVITGTNLTSTVAGLGSAGYVSTTQLFSTSAGLVNPGQLISTVQGLGTAGYASTSYVGSALSSFSTNLSRGFFTSTFATSSINANTGFISSLTVNALYIGSNTGFTNLGDVIGTSVSTLVLYTGESYATNSFTSSLNTSSLVSFSNTMRIVSSQQLIVSSINGFIPWQPSYLTSTVAGLGQAGYVSTTQLLSTSAGLVNPLQLTSTVQGLGQAGYVSTPQLLSTSLGLTNYINTFIDPPELASTVAGLGSAGYVSSTQLLSTSLGLVTYINSFIDPTELTSTVIGLGTGGFVSTLGLTYSLASTVTGLGTLGYVSTSQLLSTTVGTYNAITAATNVITGTNLTSTVAGLGSAGYISTTQLLSTSAGLAGIAASGLTQTQVTSSINNLLVPYSTLNTGAYFQIKASTNQLFFGTVGSTAQLYVGDVLSAYGNLTSINPCILVEQLATLGSFTTLNYTYTGADQSWTVPAGVTSVNVSLVGAGSWYRSANNTGTGGLVSGTLAVTPGQVITLIVGQSGQSSGSAYGGGAATGGGGRTAMRLSGADIVTAGGGGGTGGHYYSYGGNGGGTTGGAGGSSYPGGYCAGGGGGTQLAGGVAFGGAGAGSSGTGGSSAGGGGGGGGGYYGGGGGGSIGGEAAGGGGGSSYVANLTGSVVNTQGGGSVYGVNGSLTISYTPPPAVRPGNIMEIRNYQMNKFIVDPSLNVGINVSSITSGNQLDVNGTTRSINMSTQQLFVSSVNNSTLVVPVQILSTSLGLAIYISSFIDPAKLTSTVRGLGTAGYISSANLVGLVSTANLAGLVSTANLTGLVSTANLTGLVSTAYFTTQMVSTVTGLGTAGYVSSTQLLSTSLGLVTYINSFIDPTELTSTVIGLGTGGFVSTLGLTYSLASTVTGLGTLGYVSTSQLLSTTVGVYQAITAAANVITGTNLTSTVRGLGSAGYISSSQLLSTSAGLVATALTQTQVTSSINNLLVPYSTLNTATYFNIDASTSQVFFGTYGPNSQIYMGDVLAANSNTTTTNPLLLMESVPIPVPSVSQTFTYTGSDQQFTVPAGITSLTVTLSGAAGACGYNGGGAGGSGGLVSGTLPVSPGQLLYLVVGAGGTYNSGATYGGGGSGGGSTGAGGGRSAIRSVASSSSGVADTVTAGGGGGGGTANGGAGGGGTTNSGASGTNNAGDSSTGGGGGTTGAGGTAGSPGGTAGSLNTGGGGGRGGGGGYYGGGSGGATVWGSGGGGGSAYTANLTGTVTGSQGGGGGGGYYPATPGTNGYITIIYTPTPGVRPGNILEIRNYLANKFIIDPSLNVGINVSSINTSFALDVNGASRTQSVSTQQIVTSSIGVGIAKPYRRLEVLSSMRVYDGTFQTPTIEFIRNTTQGQAFGASSNADWVIAVSTGTYPNMNMYTSYTGTTTNNMTLDYTGKVGINCNTPQYQLDINGISRSCLLLSNLSGTSVTLANSNFGTYFYITNSGFSNIALTGTPSPAAGWYVSLRNNTGSYLSCTLSGQVSSTPASPLTISPANSVTIAYDNSTSLYVLL